MLGLRFSAELLCVQTKPMPESLDAIVVLGGDRDRRPMCAVELYKRTASSHVFAVGYGDCEEVAVFLKANGVSRENIVTECNSLNTMQNARFSSPLLHESGVKRAAIVTSWFHSRRALACFRKTAPDIQFASAPDRGEPSSRRLAPQKPKSGL